MADEGLFEVTDHTEISLASSEDPDIGTFTYSDVISLIKWKVELPTVLQQLFNKKPSWKFAFSNDGKLLALLYESGSQMDSILEIRSQQDNFKSDLDKTTIMSDSTPKFRQLKWSDSGSLLLLSRSSPIIDVVDINGGPCYSIDIMGKGWNHPFSLPLCVCAMETKKGTEDSKWSDHLFALTYGGNLYSYLIGRSLAGYHPDRVFDFKSSPFLANLTLTTCLCSLREQNLLVVGGNYHIASGSNADPPSALACGLSLWREVSEDPFFSMVATVSQDCSQFTNKQKKGVLAFITQKSGSVIQLAVNKKETLLAMLNTEGAIGIFHLPSLQIAHWWPLNNQATKSFKIPSTDPQDLLDSFPLNIGWWSDEAVIVARTDGSVSVLRTGTLERCTGLDLNPWPLQQAIGPGLLYIFERAYRDESTDGKTVATYQGGKLVGFVNRFLKVILGLVTRQKLQSVKIVVNQRYKLMEVISITPREMFIKRLEMEKYEEALGLAESFGFDSDLVYQRRWQKTPITKDSIDTLLKPMKNIEWILKECVTKVPNDLRTSSYLLELGLSLTQSETDMEVSSDILAYRNHVRLLLLHFHDILNDYEEWIRCDTKNQTIFDQKIFKEIREKPLLELAVNLARTGKFVLLKNLISHHYVALVPHLLTILDNIAESCDVMEFLPMLPSVDAEGKVQVSFKDRPWRSQSDPVEINGETEPPEWENWEFFYDQTGSSKEWIFPDVNSLSRELASYWFAKRCQEIESLTGLPIDSEKFLTAAVERLNFQELIGLRDQYKILSVLVYESGAQLTLKKLEEMSPLDVTCQFMQNVKTEDFLECLEFRLIPYFEHVDSQSNPAELLHDYLVNSSKSDLRNLFVLVQAWVGGKKFPHLGSAEQLTGLVSECLNACERSDHLDLGMKIVGLLSRETSPQLDEISKLFKVSETLQSYNVSLTLSQLREVANDEGESQKLLKRLVRKIIRKQLEETKGTSKAKASIGVWRSALADMLLITKEVLSRLSEHKCREYFVEGLLCSGDMATIHSVSNFIQIVRSDKADAGPESRSKVPYVPAVRLVIAAAQEYFNSAQNSKDSILDLARQCLNLMEDKSPQIMAELDLISSLPILEGMNVTRLLPIQVRLTADKTDLIKAVLNADTNAYKNLEQILKLAKLLRVDGEDKNKSRGKILVLCAGKALEHQDYKKTAEYCGEIMRLRYEPGWSICQQLGLCEKFKNREVRLDLFTFAMAYCEETTALQTLTEYIRSLKLELVMNDLEKMGKPITDTSEMESFGQLIQKSIVKLKTETKDTQMSLPKVPLFYTTLKTITPGQWEAEKSCSSSPAYRSAVSLIRAINLRQTEELMGDEDCAVLSDALVEFAILNWSKDYPMAVSALLSTGDFAKIRAQIPRFPDDSTMIETVLLCYAITSVFSSEAKDLKSVWSLSCKSLVEAALRNRRWRSFDGKTDVSTDVEQLISSLSGLWQKKTLTATSTDIDDKRFDEDTNYKRDTILGLAMTDEQEKFEVALKMAKEQGVALSDVNIAHLEFLLTESKLPVSVLISMIERQGVLSSADPDILLRNLMQKIYILLDGTSMEKMKLFYWVLQEGCAGLPEAYEAELHADLLSELMPLTSGLDYKRLTSIKSDPLSCLSPYLTAENFERIAKAAAKLPNKAVRQEDLAAVLAGKNIRTHMKQKPISEALSLSRSIMDQMDSTAFKVFINESVFSSKEKIRSTQRQQLLVLSIKYAEGRGWKSSGEFKEILLWESFLQWFIETEGLVFASLKTKDSATFDKLLGTKGNVNELTLFFEWCAIHEGIRLVQTLMDLLPSSSSVPFEPLIVGLVQKLLVALRKDSNAAALKRLTMLAAEFNIIPNRLKNHVIETIQQFAESSKCPVQFKDKLLKLK